ncbi:MAG: sulfatase [Phycisphaeraceae bacterium]
MRSLTLLLTLLLTTPTLAQPATTPPNIIFIFSDDHAAHAISAYGSTRNTTPNIDRLAAEGMLMRNFFCGNAICAPSRATLLTGLHSHANGQRTNQQTFDGSQITFPKRLQQAGYHTALIGKWHLKSDPTGFDHYEILPGQGQYYNPDYIHHTQGRHRERGFVTDLTTDKAINWLDNTRDADRPFLLMVHYKAPHRNWQPGPNELALFPDPIAEPDTLEDNHQGRSGVQSLQEMTIANDLWYGFDLALDHPDDTSQYTYQQTVARMSPDQRHAYEATFAQDNADFLKAQPNMTPSEVLRWKYQRYITNYLRVVAGVDRNIGRLLDHLDNTNLTNNTLIIYSSDQGFFLGEKGWFDKRWMYEESLRMPFIARWPGHIPPNTTSNALAQNIDIAPTLLDAANAPIPTHMHGRSILPILRGDQPDSPRDAIYYHFTASEAWHKVPAHYGVRTATHKLIYFYDHNAWELYDLALDPDERNSVYNDPAYADIQTNLTHRLQDLRTHYSDNTGKPLPTD